MVTMQSVGSQRCRIIPYKSRKLLACSIGTRQQLVINDYNYIVQMKKPPAGLTEIAGGYYTDNTHYNNKIFQSMTNKELVNFANTARAYLALKQNDKLSYAIRKVLKRVDLDLEAYNEAISDARIDFAATDSDGLLVEGKNSSFKYEPGKP